MGCLGGVIQQLVDRLEDAVAPAAPDQTRFYGWQPLPLVDFDRGMEVIGPGEGRSFLDVGSGIGSKLFLAAALGFAVEGVERHAAYAEVSRRVFPDFPVQMECAQGFERYDQFDVVYCYRPYVDPADQMRLNRVIAEQMTPDSLFFSAGGPYPDWLEPVGFQVWRI